MKKLILTSLIVLSSGAHAQHHGHYGHHVHYGHRHYGGGGWVAPLIIGGVVGAVIARESQPQPVIVQQPPVIVQPQPVYQVPYGYHYENILDAACNCYRLVLVQNN